jgi:thiamine transport system permease protein
MIYPRYRVITGLLVTVALMLVGVGAIMSLALTPLAGGQPASLFAAVDSPRVIYSVQSATIQAALSALCSICLAIPVSIAIARRRDWPGMSMLILSMSLAMVLPTTVAAMGLLAVWGRTGLFAQLCFGMCEFSIYGLHGVVLAHMMLNVPLAVRVMMPLLQAVPATKWRLCAHLGMTSRQRFYHVEWSAIRGAIPGLSSLIFLLCFTSFALVLMLGGGPAVTTLEVEIYSAIRFDFNLPAAAGLSLIQFTLTAVVVAVGAACGGVMAPFVITSDASASDRFDLSPQDQVRDWLAITLVAILILLPVGLIALNGINFGLPRLLSRPQFWDALITSTYVALTSAVMVTVLALVMAVAKAELTLPHRFGQIAGARYFRVIMDQGVMLYLVIPSVVLGTSAFIFLRNSGDVFGYAFGVVILANTLMALPFAYRLLEVRMTSLMARHDRLAAQLGIRGMVRLRVLTLPALRHDLGLIAGLSAALSFGDLGVIALFANADFRTLPWLLYQLSGKYAADEAHALATLAMLLTVGLFLTARFFMDRALRGRHA